MRKKCGGFVVEVVNDVQPNRTLVYPLYGVEKSTPVMGPGGWFHMNTEENTAYWVFNNFLKDLEDTSEVFQIGDLVQIIKSGRRGIAGEVTGFEADGSIVCRSTKYDEKSNRIRVVYSPKELRKVHKVEYKAQEVLFNDITVLAEDESGQLYMVMIK